jgi:hypothetical protein
VIIQYPKVFSKKKKKKIIVDYNHEPSVHSTT